MLENISRTGRTRLQPRIIRAGLFGKKIVLVHQTEIEGRGTHYMAGYIDHYDVSKWIDTPPAWLLEQGGEA